MGFFNYFMTIVIVSAFYSLFITTAIYSLEDSPVNIGIIISFQGDEVNLDYGTTSQEFQSAINTQKSFGGADLAALALFSGNIILDLAANFIFAFPNMVSLLVTGIFMLVPVNGFLQNEVVLWIKAIISIVSAIFLLRFLLGARTQSLGSI